MVINNIYRYENITKANVIKSCQIIPSGIAPDLALLGLSANHYLRMAPDNCLVTDCCPAWVKYNASGMAEP